jgi:ferredoxin--NADP+ reductase
MASMNQETTPKASTPPKRSETHSPGSDIVFPEVQMHLVRPTAPQVGVVVRNETCTAAGRKSAAFVRHIEVDVSKTGLAGKFRAGQSFGVVPPGNDECGRPHAVRLYSIASPTRGEDGAGNVLSTTVKRTIDEHWETHKLFLGVASNYLCDLHEGDEVLVAGPNGKRFLLPQRPEEHDYLFIATGTGIAPFRGMVQELIDLGARSKAVLVMGSPYETDLLYHADFLAKEQAHEGFTYLTAISRERDAASGRGVYVQGRIAAERDRLLPMLVSDRTLIYICGLAGMELGVFQTLARIMPREALGQYIQCDDETLAGVDEWTRRMLHKEVKPTRRVFIEVY